MQAASPIFSLSTSSPSFNSYSSTNLVDIAARVVEEFRHESGFDSDIYDNWETESFCTEEPKHEQNVSFKEEEEEEEDGEDHEEEEFEFAFVCRKPDDSPISADEIFFNGQIKPVYPLFDTTLLLNHTPDNQNPINTTISSKKTHRLPLRKLMNEDRETATTSSSCSSSEADDLENLQPGTYCVWKPEKVCKSPSAAAMRGSCKKSNSTGSSKRWKFRDLLYRSNSDGKDTFVFLAPHKKNNNSEKLIMEGDKGKVKVEEEHYVKKNRAAIREEDKKRSSYLPYRQDLVGFFSNVNGLSRNLRPF
ncbi:hypothetical protein Q3G72_017004 [Acer saccharum]|nr:hypothetical protein Q3G72_017004 [Acer saccharum]